MAIEVVKNAAASYQANGGESSAKSMNVENGSSATVKKAKAAEEENLKKAKSEEAVPEEEKQPEEKQTQSPTEALKKAVEEINKKAKNSEAVFGIHDATNRVMIKIVDKETREVMKEYPPEKTLDMIAKVWELAGLLIDEKG